MSTLSRYFSDDLTMDRINFEYSTKNIPIPSRNEFIKKLIEKTEQLCRRMRWKAYFFLNPGTQATQKNTYGFNSRKTPPQVTEMMNFENRLLRMIENVKFRHVNCTFQQHLLLDMSNIKKSESLLVPANKTNNFYRMQPADYNTLLQKNITKAYKKANSDCFTTTEAEAKAIATELKLDDRISISAKREAFVTLKDHKPNFNNNPACQLINPAKSEIGKVSKQILDLLTRKSLA